MSVAMEATEQIEQLEAAHAFEHSPEPSPAAQVQSAPAATQAAGSGQRYERETVATPDIAVTVDIYDQTYRLRGQDPAYIAGLAEIVDSKMRAVAAGGTTVDSLRVAVLAALNIADELYRSRAKYEALTGSVTHNESSLRDRTANLAGLLDSILDERKLG